ncbi:unnamed protein product [Didymodactylos carnosus]|uniref:UBC core domain-containing protein n=1 Tax=Didymodactylos carnosus TaxID=1234261 RepID=A0A814F5F4_9BILA|nr:unnamed protein product [Didymodactylos carnosus]CAF1089308.1 unnamed protein product [Didymodactylos carnosus]CAF3753027.1 unnamed protein product [Didymodactylos carnosus]CAF3851016.1 unnamed protein product [Didymodactylos carnosus]
MAARLRRITTEIRKLEAVSSIFLIETTPVTQQEDKITGRVLPNSEPYSEGEYRIEINLPPDYPFKAPEVRFLTEIYHPDVELPDGKICLELLSVEKWLATTSVVDIVKAVVDMIDKPKLDNPLNTVMALEYKNNPAQFREKAAEYIKKYALH